MTALATTTVDRTPVIATLFVAFAADPVIRWLFPDAGRYLTHFPELVRLECGAAFSAGTADRTPGDEGAALWIPPGAASDDEAFIELLQRSLDADRHDAVFGFLEHVEAHRPADPHWYLGFIGVDPERQGQGHGRHGFRVLAEIRAGDSPPLWPMRRPPRPPASGEGPGRAAPAHRKQRPSPR